MPLLNLGLDIIPSESDLQYLLDLLPDTRWEHTGTDGRIFAHLLLVNGHFIAFRDADRQNSGMLAFLMDGERDPETVAHADDCCSDMLDHLRGGFLAPARPVAV